MTVTHPIERTLAILKDVMSAHSAALTGKPAGRAAPLPLPTDRRSVLALRLMQGVERHAGLEFSPALAEKLLTQIAPLSLGALEARVMELEALPQDAPEWRRLSESLTVHETYFLRDQPQLSLLASCLPALIAEAEARRHPVLRLWSVGCATGEEAYSLGMLALDALVAAGKAVERVDGIVPTPPWRIEVLGSDLSSTVLDHAKAGLYETGPLSSFRDLPPAYLRYFPPHRGQSVRRVREDLRAVLRFEPFNLTLDPAPEPAFDLVLCRNVLIYLSDRARLQSQGVLCGAVRQGGYLMLGATDSIGAGTGFETRWGEDAAIHRRRHD